MPGEPSCPEEAPAPRHSSGPAGAGGLLPGCGVDRRRRRSGEGERPVLAGRTRSRTGLNDPSIIFAQPAARPVAIPSSSHDGHWPRTVAPNSLVNNEPGFPGLNPPIPWEHAPRPHFPLVPASWPYGLHQNFMHQGNARFQPNKPFYTPADRCATRRCRERCPHPPRGNVSE